MTADPLVRLAALGAAVFAARRGSVRSLAVAGAAAGLAAFGLLPRQLPAPLWGAGAAVLAFSAAALLLHGTWSPLTAEALPDGFALAVPSALVAAASLRGQPFPAIAFGALVVLASVSLFAAEGCRANAEAGWRRVAGWVTAVGAPSAATLALLEGGRRAQERLAWLPPLAAALLALAAWALPHLSESRRVRRELSEEAGLGILPAEDVEVLVNPWRRLREGRLGRADERRTYVRSALLLAVVRQQQRRRSGESNRLRQLEVISFRTRLRRTVNARMENRAAPVPEELQ